MLMQESQTVIHTAQHWNRLSKRDRISFHVVVDSMPNPFVGMLPDFVELLEVPSSFRPDHARHKARVLEWCRRHWRLSEEDWVLHLDEETEITEEVMSSCFDFIERGAEDIGMVRSANALRKLDAESWLLREQSSTTPTITGRTPS